MKLISFVVLSFLFSCASAGGFPPVFNPSAAREYVSLDHPGYDIDFEDIITDESVAEFSDKLVMLTGKADTINIRINTPGGSVVAALAMAKALELAAITSDVVCTVDGGAYSAGFYILQFCEKRYMTPRSMLMAHEPYLMVQGAITIGTAEDMIQMLVAVRRVYAEQCASRMSIDVAWFIAKIKDREWWLTAEEAYENNAIDGIRLNPSAELAE